MSQDFDINEWKWNQLLKEGQFDPKKSDLDKDGKISDYEKKRGMAVAKNVKEAVPFKKDALGEQPAYMPHDAENLEEHDWKNDPKDESSMVSVQLKSIMNLAQALLQMNREGNQYDAWVQAKITKAQDYLQSVHDYHKYEDHDANEID
jgi:hypothetical protein